MPLVQENQVLCIQRQELYRKLDKHELTEEQFKEQFDIIESKIAENLMGYVKENNDKIRTERPIIVGKSKNEIKHLLGDWMKTLLQDLDDRTKKGVFRSAYKSLKVTDGDEE